MKSVQRVTLVLVAEVFILWIAALVTAQQYYSGENGGIETVWARSGSNATLNCRGASGGRRMLSRFQWWQEDRQLAKWENGQLKLWDGKAHVSLDPVMHALIFAPVAYSDSGEYQCLVDSQIGLSGTREGIIRLRVQDHPDPPGRPMITSFTSRSVNLSWAPSIDNRNSPILYYIIHVRVGEMGAWDMSNNIRTSDNHTVHPVGGLLPYTVYSFRVVAVNAIGASEPSIESYYMVTLREVPAGKPIITGAHNVSSSSIRVQWAPPPKQTIHGEFVGYRLTYRPRERADAQREIILNDPSLGHYTIRNLDAFTDYTISVQVFNPAGRGPAAMLNAMTDEGVPSAPLNLTKIKVNTDCVRLRWQKPEYPNGILRAYHVYYLELAEDKTMVKIVPISEEPKSVTNFTLEDLKPYTQYKIWVKAKTSKDEGAASKTLLVKTDVDGPSAPRIFNLTCQSLDSLYLQWQQPDTFYHKIDYYYVFYRSENSYSFEEIPTLAAQDRTDHAMFIPNLTSNMLYEVMVQGASHSIVEPSKVYKGAVSVPRKVILREKCTVISVNGNSPYIDNSLTAGMTAGAVCAAFALILAIISFILWRKYFQAAYYYLDDPPGNRASPQLSETYDETEYTSVPTHLWGKHVADLHADGDIGFSREYEAIQHVSDLDLSSEHSQLVENKTKNRYVNIVAYDHTRVVLKGAPGQKKGPDYINANYIDGYCKSRSYIGTQGPLPSTFDDYWRMIWEQRVYIVVMITNLVERGRHDPSTSELDDTRKCDMYWPKEGSENYGIIQVKMIQEVVMATYTVRSFLIKNLKIKKQKQTSERMVYQYHYTNWPDHGVPEHSLPVLSFVRKSSAANPPNGGPIIVHCSAGVGRTGTYIVVDAMLKQIAHRQSINVFGFLRHIRQQRNYLVQTEEQYIFIHDALLEALESGDTEVEKAQLTRYLQTLQQPETNDLVADIEKVNTHSWPALERQFRLVTSFKAKDFNVVSALKPCNKTKNRSLNLIPIESHRVHITPKPATDGSDYINGTFLHGFNKLREFVLTQHPLFETIADFWQMVWDHNSQTIVLLTPIIEKEFPQFWPDSGEESDYGSFKLKLSEEKSTNKCVTRSFILQSTQDDYELTCRLMQCADWPSSCSSPLPTLFELIQLVQDWHLEYQNGPMIVVDRFGGTEAATFCALTTLYKQLEYENSVDVYVCAKLYHIRRPGIWKSQDDYLFLYRAVESIANAEVCSEGTGGCAPGGGANNPEAGSVTNGHANSNGHAVLPNKGASQAAG